MNLVKDGYNLYSRLFELDENRTRFLHATSGEERNKRVLSRNRNYHLKTPLPSRMDPQFLPDLVDARNYEMTTQYSDDKKFTKEMVLPHCTSSNKLATCQGHT